MTLTTNAHDITKAEARGLAGVDDDALQFSSEHGHVTLFVPPSVAKATADAFNKAMQEHLAAASQRDKAGGGAGFSSNAAPLPTNPEARDRMIRAKFEEGCG
jgi:hypothetical protein